MSFNMAPFDGSYTTHYWFVIVGIALFVPFSSCLTLKNIVTLKSGLRIMQGHWKWHHLKAWLWFPICLP